MVNYGKFDIFMSDVVNDAFVRFSYDYDSVLSFEDLLSVLLCYGLVELGYLKLSDLPFED